MLELFGVLVAMAVAGVVLFGLVLIASLIGATMKIIFFPISLVFVLLKWLIVLVVLTVVASVVIPILLTIAAVMIPLLFLAMIVFVGAHLIF
ncbi:MAG: hypothetical protein WBX15_11970 [Thermoanaerobaculia bacterium]